MKCKLQEVVLRQSFQCAVEIVTNRIENNPVELSSPKAMKGKLQETSIGLQNNTQDKTVLKTFAVGRSGV